MSKSSRCSLCSVSVPGCYICTYNDPIITCNNCSEPDYIPVTGNNSCFKCSTLKSCITCATPSQCVNCIDNWFAEDGACVQCQEWIPNCIQCINNKTCSVCNDAYYKN